jgi:hypothetical protein
MNHHPSNEPVTKSPTRSQFNIAVFIGVLLAATVGILAYYNVQQDKELTAYQLQESNALDSIYLENAETSSLRTEMESAYENAIAELESLKGVNAELNGRIEAQQAELADQKGRISELLKDRQQLGKARKAIETMKVEIAGYLADIEKMKAENVELASSNQQLATNLQTREVEYAQLNETKAVLVSQNEDLTRTVKIGSVIKVKDVRTDPLKVRSNGKVKEKSSAKQVDQLKVCFTTVANEVAQPGTEEFQVRIVNPRGETMAQEDLGSGTIFDEKTGEEVRFTQSAQLDFNHDEQNVCMTWNPTGKFESGTYNIEIYNKGHLAGKGNFKLK